MRFGFGFGFGNSASASASASACSTLRSKVKSSSVTVTMKCLAILQWLITAPTARAILSLPRSGRFPRQTRA